MKRIVRYIALLAVGALTLTACHDDEICEFNFNATMEQPTATDGSKVYLQDERFIYWELNDKITIASDQGQVDDKGNYYEARLVDASATSVNGENDFGFFNGVFVTTMAWGSNYFLGIHPKMDIAVMGGNYCSTSSGSSDFGTTVKMYLPTEQSLRTDDKGDFTFNKQVWPMVAWYGGTWTDTTTAFNLDFHSLGSILRFHLYNTTGSEFTLDSIEFVSKDNGVQLSGIFNVKDYKTEDPYLVSPASATASNARVAIANPTGSSLDVTFNTSTLRTFYLVLPAYKGRHESTTYQLTMNVYAKQGGTPRTFSKNLTVTTRRNGITNMRAVAIDSWSSPTLPEGLSGCGTQARPFKVYNYSDLLYLRRCYQNDVRVINQQPITENTWIRIMRSDIVISPDWATSGGGINEFTGHMVYATTGTNTTQAITNNSLAPLFRSISTQGHVEGITINCDTSLSINTGSHTPFCITNRGEIRNCRVMSNITTGTHSNIINVNTPAGSGTTTVAGICLTNTGTIIGSGCVARFDAERCNVAGICYNNQGTITGCYVAAPTTVLRADNVAGVCYLNTVDGSVKDCYFATAITGVTYNCGGIVFDNRGLVEHCYMGDAATINTTGSVGGIVNTNTGDGANCKVNYCFADATLTGSTVGLIAATVSNGRILNCFCNNNITIVTLRANDDLHYGGGLVGELNGGSIENSFVYDNKIRRIDNKGIIGGLVGKVSGTTARIKNCYSYEYSSGSQVFYGELNAVDDDLFSGCYLVGAVYGGTATGITSVTVGDGYFDNMRLALNGNSEPDAPAGWDSDWYRWEAQSSTIHLPRLTAYSASNKRR